MYWTIIIPKKVSATTSEIEFVDCGREKRKDDPSDVDTEQNLDNLVMNYTEDPLENKSIVRSEMINKNDNDVYSQILVEVTENRILTNENISDEIGTSDILKLSREDLIKEEVTENIEY